MDGGIGHLSDTAFGRDAVDASLRVRTDGQKQMNAERIS